MTEIFTNITSRILTVMQAKIDSSIALIPYVAGALAMFLFGWVLAILASRAIISLSEKLRLEKLAEFFGLKHFLEHTKVKMSPSRVIAKSVKAYLMFLFFIEATKVAKMTEVADFLSDIISYVPQLIIALFIILVGIRIGHTMELIISTSLGFAKETTAKVLGLAARYTMIAFAALAALSQLNIAEILVQTLFIGFIAMLTIAGGLAFGLGGKDVVKELLENLKNMELIEYMQTKREEAEAESREKK